jgi:hypothetical protein
MTAKGVKNYIYTCLGGGDEQGLFYRFLFMAQTELQ